MLWSRNYLISEISRTIAEVGDNPAEATITTRAIFEKDNAKRYIHVVTLSINNRITFLGHLRQVFRRTIS